jgi:hypothetical protein
MLSSTIHIFRQALPAALLGFFLLPAACSDETKSDGSGDGDIGDAGAEGDGAASGDDDENGADASDQPSGADTTRPTVLWNYPLDMATDQAAAVEVSATFSEAMAPLTLTDATFGIKQGETEVPGVVSYFDNKVTFVPTSNLALGTSYTATLTTGASDLAGNALAESYTWTFTTDDAAAVGPAPVFLGAAGGFVILAKAAISNVPTSAITGNVGLSPAAASYITGFALTRAGTKWTCPEVVGSLFAANNDPPTPNNLTVAVGSMQTAYTDAAGRPTPTFLDLEAGTIGGLTLAPGLYRWNSTVTIPADIAIAGAPNDTWIFQVTGDLKLSGGKQMKLSGGAQAKNIVWQVAGAVDFGTTSHAEGIILAKTAIKLGTGASINGRLFAQTAVNIASSTVKAPAP